LVLGAPRAATSSVSLAREHSISLLFDRFVVFAVPLMGRQVSSEHQSIK
jgi:hypothetical protein